MAKKELEPNQKEIEATKLAHVDRELFLIEGPHYTVIARVPMGMEVTRWRKDTAEAANRARATSFFVTNAIVWPDAPRLLELLNRRPFLLEEWFSKIYAEAGGAEETEVKKL